MMYTVRPSSIG